MKCIIIEDQPPAQRILKRYIQDIGTLELRGVFSDAVQAMSILSSEPIDLMFLDIHLPKMSGIAFFKTLVHPPHVILTTAFPDYALEGYELNVVDYLLKPFSFQRFVKAVAKVPVKAPPKRSGQAQAEQAPTQKELFIKSGYEWIKVVLNEILYIKSDTDYTEIFTAAKKHLSSEPLRYWLESLDPEQFVRVHKSYIINTNKIERISSTQVLLEEEIIIPVGRAYKDDFMARFINGS